MKLSIRNVKRAWKYRRALWKYRNLIRHRRQIAGVAMVGAALAAGVLVKRSAKSYR